MDSSTPSNNSFVTSTSNDASTFTTEELSITLLYYITAFLIVVISLVFINKRI